MRLYLQPEKLSQHLTTLRLLTQPVEALHEQAKQLQSVLLTKLTTDYSVAITNSVAQIGSGSQPMATIPSVAVTISTEKAGKLTALLQRFKALPQPIICRVEKEKFG